MAKRLSSKQLLFVSEYCTGKSAVDAALAAGYSATYAKHAAGELLQNPQVAAELEARRDAIRQKTELTAETAIRECEEMAVAAMAAKQMTAAVNARVTKYRLSGLLFDKATLTVERIDLRGALENARAREIERARERAFGAITVTPQRIEPPKSDDEHIVGD